MLGLQSYVFGRSRVSVDVDIADDVPPISVDRSQLQQVLVNLTLNAAQAIRSQGRPGRMSIGARLKDGLPGRVAITISDDGPGVPTEIRDGLFMPFVTSKAPGEGTGLGLSVSRAIVAAHGGTLEYGPREGGGTTFTIELPVAPSGDMSASREAADPPTLGARRLRGARSDPHRPRRHHRAWGRTPLACSCSMTSRPSATFSGGS